MEQLSIKKGCTTAQFALAWVMAQGENIFPIPGTKRIKYLTDNAAACKVIFTQKELDTINIIAPKNIAAGARYPV